MVTEQPKLRGDHHQRWEHIARELGDWDLVDTGSAYQPWNGMRRVFDDSYVGDWVEAEAAGKAIEAREERIAELEKDLASIGALAFRDGLPCWCNALRPENHHAYCVKARRAIQEAKEVKRG